MAERQHFPGPLYEITASAFDGLTTVLAEWIRLADRTTPWILFAHQSESGTLRAMIDCFNPAIDMVVYAEQDTKRHQVRIVRRPDGVSLPPAEKGRYGIRRCAWCALRLPWWRWDILPYCDACKPDPHQGGRPRFGRRTLTRGSRWDTA